MSDQAERLFEQALALQPEVRAAFVEDASLHDPALREELMSLLQDADAAGEFFDRLSEAVFSSPFSSGGEENLAAQPQDSELPEGDMAGHYRITSFIGRGGMGSVYRAYDTRLNRNVALKFLPSYLGAEPDAQERLLMEARAAAALDHPNVCSIHEIGETDDGRPFIAMPCYEGETLKKRLRRGPLPLEESVTTAIQIARGLNAASSRGIIHRDVKPGNVILGSDGTVHLLDFGLATVIDANLANSGITPGTVAYMSPEHARGKAIDLRTDLWSLGVVLYELESLVRLKEGKGAKAITLMRRAAAIEDATPVEFGPPVVIKPTHELLAEILLESGMVREAQREFARALKLTPGRARSLLGLAKASKKMGDSATAAKAYSDLRAVWHRADASVLPVQRR